MPQPVTSPRIGLALAGGGPLGAIYEIGALCALEEVLQGVSLTQCHGYVGVSAGGFIAAGLANGYTPRELCRAFIENLGPASEVFEPSLLVRRANSCAAGPRCPACWVRRPGTMPSAGAR
jgi:NTE family protein